MLHYPLLESLRRKLPTNDNIIIPCHSMDCTGNKCVYFLASPLIIHIPDNRKCLNQVPSSLQLQCNVYYSTMKMLVTVSHDDFIHVGAVGLKYLW